MNTITFLRSTLLFISLVCCIFGATNVTSSIPSEPLYYTEQLIDHFDANRTYSNGNTSSSSSYWTQRYYVYDKYYNGPGYPIFVILGGEGSIEPNVGILYPFIVHYLAFNFGAYVLQIEHRFYGASYPISRTDIDVSQRKGGADPRNGIFTYEQALYDAARLIQKIQTDHLLCSRVKTSADYCPIITVGGSYPGFLSAMMKIVFPHLVDIAYAASAPMKFYSQQLIGKEDAYYQHITNVTETAVPGCAAAVHTTLHQLQALLLDPDTVIDPELLGICRDTIPSYCYEDHTTKQKLQRDILLQEINMIGGYTFANANMAYYPPSPTTKRLGQMCTTVFMKDELSPMEKLHAFFTSSFITLPNNKYDSYSNIEDAGTLSSSSSSPPSCFNMSSQLPHGKNATISSGDWSGVGTNYDGDSWDYQTCTLLIERISFNNVTTMFLQRNFTLQWLKRHCSSRYNNISKPQPYSINTKYHIDDLSSIPGLSNIIFTNGLNDGWSVSGIQENISDTIIALNFPNGAHHSDLSGIGPNANDTTDIKQGYFQINSYITKWLSQLPGGKHSSIFQRQGQEFTDSAR